MAVSTAYKKTLKQRLIQDFVKENLRSPTPEEQKDLLLKEYARFSGIDEVGLVGFEVIKPGFRKESSAAEENINRRALYDDLLTLTERTDDLGQLLEDSFRGYQATGKRTSRLLSQIESRLDNLLLLNNHVDVFVYGIEETFDTQENINLTDSTVSVESNWCTSSRGGYNTVNLTETKLSVSTTSAKGVVGTQSSSDINLLREDDGSFWEHLVYTKYRQGRVSLSLELDFGEGIYVGDLRLTGNPVSANRHTTATIFYSIDGATFTALEPVETVVESSETTFNVGVDNVRKIQILLSKEASDNSTVTKNQYVYIFSLDSIKVFTDGFNVHAVDTLYAGPYEVINEEGGAVNFTKCTLNACTNEPDDTSVSFFISKDGENYEAVNHRGESLNIVSFADGSKVGTFGFVDETLSAGILLGEVAGVDEIDFADEAVLNIYLLEDFVETVPLKSVVLKRNVITTTSAANVYNVSSGWHLDQNLSRYNTTIYISAQEGRYIDFGNTGVYVNDNLVSGRVWLGQGYNRISTAESNWLEIEEELTSLTELIDADPLYPYNHKYLLEGYTYGNGFTGERIYNGVDEYFGRLLRYSPPEEFNSCACDGDLDVFTIEQTDGNAYFKVKVDKTDATWESEIFDVDWNTHAGESNIVYVKAILTTSNQEKTPAIKNFKIRVI